ncbi:nucleolar protein 14 [Rhodotorula diobovata]|uniref:Nucleolar protein 14 n=1 Tax=Rhodotorula diobovata TaxID=5288 RepID=A0A5C5G4Y8_9BASI|nr:nucleolar protein 14 [Rhodotorula diobovata]
MGGSQLSQLRAKLKDSGLNRQSNPRDQRKRTKQRNDHSSTSLQHRSQKLQQIHDQFNLFDVRDEKTKFAVVTRSGKEEGGVKGMPGRARAAGIESRKKSLLPMLDARTHASTFVDHRFGEASSTLTPEEKALERFTAERQSRLSKKARFNLEDGDDAEAGGEISLTHGGRKLGFGDEDQLEDGGGWGGFGPGEGANREPLLNRRKMGAEPEAEEDPDRKKTHAEIMNEVVAKAKFHKAERQKMRSADDETRLELDQGLKDLRGLLAGGGKGPARPSAAAGASAAAAGSDDEDEEMDDSEADEDEDEDEDEAGDSDDDDDSDAGSTYELNDEELEAALAASSSKSGVDRDLLRKLIGSAADRSESPEAAPAAAPTADAAPIERPPPAAAAAADDDDSRDPYDLYVRQLALEPRAQATNRLKTPLELAQEAAEQLRAQEARRLKRQRGEADLSGSGSEEEGEGKAGKRRERKRRPQGDDLEDDYLEEQYGSGAEGEEEEVAGEGAAFGKGLEGEGVRLGAEEDEQEGSEEDEEDEGDEEEGEDEEGSDDEMDVGDLDEPDSEEEAAGAGETEALVASTSAKFDQAGELPYTFPCPSSHAEFARLLRSSGIRDEDTITVVKRIRTLYHPGLAEGNKDKLQVFTNVLLDHVIFLCASPPSPSTFRTVNSLLPPLLTLTHAYPLTSAPHYVKKLSLMHKNLLRGLVRGPLDPAAKTWPGLPELTLLRLVGMVWSASDLSHPVAAPAQLLIGEYLSQSRVRSLADVASGLFLCSLAAQYESLAKRIVPEAVNFLANALALLLPVSSAVVSAKTFPGSFPTPDIGQEHTKGLKLRAAKGLAPSASVNLVEALSAKGGKVPVDKAEQLKVDLVASAVALVETFRGMYADSEAFPELFQPLEGVLKAVKLDKVPEQLRTLLSTTLDSLSKALRFALESRKPLFMQHHKPIPLATFLPKFDEGFNPNRRFDPDSERAEASKLRALYKKEKKGAVRELRNDNRFLAVEEAKRKRADDVQYEKKISKIVSSLQDERAEEKAFERTKARGQRRDKARAGKR